MLLKGKKYSVKKKLDLVEKNLDLFQKTLDFLAGWTKSRMNLP
jgi:hypothetical protein